VFATKASLMHWQKLPLWVVCSLIPGLAVKLSTNILTGPAVLSAVEQTLHMMETSGGEERNRQLHPRLDVLKRELLRFPEAGHYEH
jgi:hypothetical protein